MYTLFVEKMIQEIQENILCEKQVNISVSQVNISVSAF